MKAARITQPEENDYSIEGLTFAELEILTALLGRVGGAGDTHTREAIDGLYHLLYQETGYDTVELPVFGALVATDDPIQALEGEEFIKAARFVVGLENSLYDVAVSFGLVEEVEPEEGA